VSTKRKLDLCPGNACGRRKLRRAKLRFKQALLNSKAFVAPVMTRDAFFINIPSGGFPELPDAVQDLDRKPWPRVELKPDIEVGPAWDDVHEPVRLQPAYRQPMSAPPIQSSASNTVLRVLSNPGIDDHVTMATQFEGIMRRHGASEADGDVVRERFLKAYPQLKALAQQLKALAQQLKGKK
jgi:hypothetical protein